MCRITDFDGKVDYAKLRKIALVAKNNAGASTLAPGFLANRNERAFGGNRAGFGISSQEDPSAIRFKAEIPTDVPDVPAGRENLGKHTAAIMDGGIYTGKLNRRTLNESFDAPQPECDGPNETLQGQDVHEKCDLENYYRANNCAKGDNKKKRHNQRKNIPGRKVIAWSK